MQRVNESRLLVLNGHFTMLVALRLLRNVPWEVLPKPMPREESAQAFRHSLTLM